MRTPKHVPVSLNSAHNQRPARIYRIALALLAISFVTPALWAQQLNILTNFSGPNGNGPGGKLAIDAAGNIYGTTFYGGRLGDFGPGTVYRLAHHGSGWVLTSLYDFTGYDDGKNPWGGISFGPDGALYGTTYAGGTYGEGVVFKLQPQPTRCTTALCYWDETVIYNFTGGADGGAPQGALIFDSAGDLYGTTLGGGQNSNGIVYELSPAQGSWSFNVLYRFMGGSDGAGPEDGVVMDGSGKLFGTTFIGGADSDGTVYELAHGQSGWTETVLHSFTGGDDGIYPTVPVVDPSGNVFGATSEGGANGDGTVFELQPNGSGGFSYSIIYQFNSAAGPPCDAECGFTLNSAGNLYSSGYGGMNGGGTIFELSPSNGSWNLTVLWDFTVRQGYEPSSRPILDAHGNVYGTTEYGGDNDGNVWQLTP